MKKWYRRRQLRWVECDVSAVYYRHMPSHVHRIPALSTNEISLIDSIAIIIQYLTTLYYNYLVVLMCL